MDNIKLVDKNEDMTELMELIEHWQENKYEIKRLNPFEIIINMYYKDWGRSGTIKYNISSNTFRCINKLQRFLQHGHPKRKMKTDEAIRTLLNKIYVEFSKTK